MCQTKQRITGNGEEIVYRTDKIQYGNNHELYKWMRLASLGAPSKVFSLDLKREGKQSSVHGGRRIPPSVAQATDDCGIAASHLSDIAFHFHI
jgi:hypothetical protein